jgi:hypothetical protein
MKLCNNKLNQNAPVDNMALVEMNLDAKTRCLLKVSIPLHPSHFHNYKKTHCITSA